VRKIAGAAISDKLILLLEAGEQNGALRGGGRMGCQCRVKLATVQEKF
jgi:hypothetical protein